MGSEHETLFDPNERAKSRKSAIKSKHTVQDTKLLKDERSLSTPITNQKGEGKTNEGTRKLHRWGGTRDM